MTRTPHRLLSLAMASIVTLLMIGGVSGIADRQFDDARMAAAGMQPVATAAAKPARA